MSSELGIENLFLFSNYESYNFNVESFNRLVE